MTPHNDANDACRIPTQFSIRRMRLTQCTAKFSNMSVGRRTRDGGAGD
jgi:hypothetical protein